MKKIRGEIKDLSVYRKYLPFCQKKKKIVKKKVLISITAQCILWNGDTGKSLIPHTFLM